MSSKVVPSTLQPISIKDRFANISVRREPSLAPKPAPPDRLAKLTVIAFACFVILLVLVAAFFTERNGDVDELMMYNPAYMLAHFGKLTFPTYPFRGVYDDPVIIHPPIHLGLIGLLERLGLTWYYAEAVPVVLFLLLDIAVIVFSAFSAPVKLGLLFSIGFLVATGEQFVMFFGTRPEGHLYATWFAGLLLLESGRLANWNRHRLLAGAFLLTWASGVHYYGCAAFAGVVVYVVWSIRDLGWRDARSRVLALSVGSCLFGIPYAGLYLLPHLKKILMYVQLAKAGGGLSDSVRLHFQNYRIWAHRDYLPALIRRSAALGIPLMVFSTLVMGALKSIRGIALAALPLQLFVFLFAAHKLPSYLIHEVGMFAASACVGVLVLCDWSWRRIPAARFHSAFLPIAAILLALYLVTDSVTLKAAQVSGAAHVHEGDVARAATRQILGPHARVAGRSGAWYTSGAEYWYDIERDMLVDSPSDPVTLFSNFDAVADYAHQSQTSKNATVSLLYADGTLKLRGFYFGETNEQLQLVLLSMQRVSQVVGYVAERGKLYRFREQQAGDYQLLVGACPIVPQFRPENWINRWTDTYSAVLYLPKPTPGAPEVVATVLAPRRLLEPAAWMRRSCKEVTTLNGTLDPADKEALLNSLRREDTPMRFPRSLDELPGYTGFSVPAEMRLPRNAVRLNQVLRLSDAQTPHGIRLRGTPPFTVRTISTNGAFALAIPVAHGDLVATDCWLQLRLKVDAGLVGFAAYSRRHGILNRTHVSILRSSEPIDVALRMPNLRDTTDIMVFNDGDVAGQVEILDSAVFVTQADWERDKASLTAVQ